MRILTLAIISWSVLTSLSIATPQRYATGIPSLDAFLKAKPAGQEVVGITGFYGQDQPQQWLLLVKDPMSESFMMEYVVSNSEIQGSRRMRKLPVQDLPSIAIDRTRLKVDSDIAFDVAESLARKANVGYDSVHYQLRCREQNHEPVWMVNMLDPTGRSVGIHYISAESGTILRSVWHKINREALTKTKGPDGKPVNLLYGAEIREITVSGDISDQKRRQVTRIIPPTATTLTGAKSSSGR